MSKILTVDEMLAAAEDSGMPELEKYIGMVEAVASSLQKRLAQHLDITHGEATYERDFGGTCGSFYPKTPDQPCPDVIEAGDEGGDWEFRKIKD